MPLPDVLLLALCVGKMHDTSAMRHGWRLANKWRGQTESSAFCSNHPFKMSFENGVSAETAGLLSVSSAVWEVSTSVEAIARASSTVRKSRLSRSSSFLSCCSMRAFSNASDGSVSPGLLCHETYQFLSKLLKPSQSFSTF